MGKPLDPKEVETIRRVFRETGGSLLGTANKTGHNRETVRKAVGGAGKNEDDGAVEEGRKFSEGEDGTATLVLNTDRIVRTLDDAIEVGEVDTAVWYVDTYEIADWTTTMRVRQGQDESGMYRPDKPIRTQQYRVKLKLRRIVPRSVHSALELVVERFRRLKPVRVVGGRRKPAGREDVLAVAGLVDVHFGKLAWAAETGDDYDVKIATAVFHNAVSDMIRRFAGRKIRQVLLPLGNDFLHVDNSVNTTTRGTQQDVDGRLAKVYAAAVESAVWAVGELAAVAPVRVEWVPGNHDRVLSLTLCHVVAARFHGEKRVDVDLSPKHRKYYRWGNNLLGLTHGDEVKPEQLPILMATEAPADWDATKHGTREWLIGHMHRSRKWVSKPVDTFEGTTVRTLQSLAGTDAYHHEHGFISTRHAAEVLFYGWHDGYHGHEVVVARR